MKKTFIVTILLLAGFQAGAQDWNTKEMKAWADGPLGFEDFSNRKSDDPTCAGEILWEYTTTLANNKVGNLSYTYCKVDLYMDKLNSWYDPNSFLDNIKYFQTGFDILESVKRQMQNEINLNPRQAREISQYYFRVADSRSMTFQQESSRGLDQEVVDKYAAEVAEELASIPDDPVSAPEVGERTVALGMYGGIAGDCLIGGIREGVPMSYGVTFGFDFLYKSWTVYLDAFMGGPSQLRTDGFYYDRRYDYDWVKGENVIGCTVNFQAGYRVFDTDNVAITPFAGFGVRELVQKDSEISGFRLMAGAQFSYKLSRSINCFEGSYMENCLNFRLYGATASLPQIGRFYSINFGIVLDWTEWLLH